MRVYQRIITAFIDVVRPALGFQRMVCIYQKSCHDYAKESIQQNTLFTAILKILLRLLSCNPITAIIRCYWQ